MRVFAHANEGKRRIQFTPFWFSNSSERGKPGTFWRFQQSLFQKELWLFHCTKKMKEKRKKKGGVGGGMNWITLVLLFDVQPCTEVYIYSLGSVQCIEFVLCFMKHAAVIKVDFCVKPNLQHASVTSCHFCFM